MFHGNAGNIGHRVPIAKMLEENLGCNVFMLEYRGYGLSTGTPDEKGINIDAQAALDYIRNQKETEGGKIVVFGQSLGGAVAVQLVAKNEEAGDIAALILENTFTSIKEMIPRSVAPKTFLGDMLNFPSVFPPARYITSLCHQYWPSKQTLPQVTKIPVLFLSGLKDEIVP